LADKQSAAEYIHVEMLANGNIHLWCWTFIFYVNYLCWCLCIPLHVYWL